MKITISGSVKFAKNLVEVYRQLEKMGHQPMMHQEMFGIADGTAKELIDGIALDHAETKRKYDFIKWWHNCIKAGMQFWFAILTRTGSKIISAETPLWK